MDQLVKTQAERNALRHEVADLRAQVEWFKRNLFGQGKSETFDALQTRLKFDDEVIHQRSLQLQKNRSITSDRS